MTLTARARSVIGKGWMRIFSRDFFGKSRGPRESANTKKFAIWIILVEFSFSHFISGFKA